MTMGLETKKVGNHSSKDYIVEQGKILRLINEAVLFWRAIKLAIMYETHKLTSFSNSSSSSLESSFDLTDLSVP
jgi:hypothetical protein